VLLFESFPIQRPKVEFGFLRCFLIILYLNLVFKKKLVMSHQNQSPSRKGHYSSGSGQGLARRESRLSQVKEESRNGSPSSSLTSPSLSTATSPVHSHPHGGNPGQPYSQTTGSRMDLKKEYVRFCKLYSSEPLDIISSPLQKANEARDREATVDLRGRGLRGVDCIAIGRILAMDLPIACLNLSDCLLLPQGFQVRPCHVIL